MPHSKEARCMKVHSKMANLMVMEDIMVGIQAMKVTGVKVIITVKEYIKGVVDTRL